MKVILEDEEINILNQILADFPIRELSKVQQVMSILESKIEKEDVSEQEEASEELES